MPARSVAGKTAPKQKAGKQRAGDGRLERIALGMIALGAVLVVIVGVLFGLGVLKLGSRPTELTGAIVNDAPPAPDFQLQDQFGQSITMSNFKGKVVVLTFLYTNCPDACPLIAEKFGTTYDMLGADAAKTQFLAITVDPERDTVAQVHNFSAQHNILQKWHFLVGPAPKLQSIWEAYGIGADRGLPFTPAPGTTPTSDAKYLVDHSAPIFVIDPAGQIRVLLDIEFQPSELIQNVRVLLR